MRYSHRAVLIAPFLLNTAVAQSPNDFQRMDNLPSLDCTTAWNSNMPYCSYSDFENGAACSPGCAYGVQSTQSGIQQVCQGAHYMPGSLMALFMAGNGAEALCPNAVTTQTTSASIQTTLSVSSVSRPTSLAFPTASSTVTSTVTTTESIASSSISPHPSSLTTTVVLQSTFVTHMTATLTSTSKSSSPSNTTSSSIPASTSTSSPSSSSTTTPTTSGIIQTTGNGASVTVLSSATSGIVQTAGNGASVTVQGSATSAFLRTAVNGGSATVLSSKPAQTGSTNPDAFGGGGSPFEISSPASRLTCSAWSWTFGLVLGCMVRMVWV